MLTSVGKIINAWLQPMGIARKSVVLSQAALGWPHDRKREGAEKGVGSSRHTKLHSKKERIKKVSCLSVSFFKQLLRFGERL